MKPISFTKFETVFVGQSTETAPLPTKIIQYSDGTKAIVSCWKPSFIDWLRVLIGKPVYLVILGTRQPPVLLSTDAIEVGAADLSEPDEIEQNVEVDMKTGDVTW